MTKEEQEKVRLKVEKKIRRTKEEIEYLKELTQPISPDNALGRITRMDAINNKSVNEATLRHSKATLSQLEYTLKRITNNDKTFGSCSNCGAEIPLPRILLMPESDKCVSCAK